MNAFTESKTEIFSLDELKQLGFPSFCGFMHDTFCFPKLISCEVKETRASVYYLPGQKSVELSLSFLDKLETSSPDFGGNPIGLSGNSPGLGGSSSGLDGNPIGLTRKRDAILASFGLEKIPGKMKHDAMRKLIVQLCDDSFVTLRELSKLLNRNQAFIQHDYISGMLSEGLLELKYPESKYHPNQAYRRKR